MGLFACAGNDLQVELRCIDSPARRARLVADRRTPVACGAQGYSPDDLSGIGKASDFRVRWCASDIAQGGRRAGVGRHPADEVDAVAPSRQPKRGSRSGATGSFLCTWFSPKSGAVPGELARCARPPSLPRIKRCGSREWHGKRELAGEGMAGVGRLGAGRLAAGSEAFEVMF